MLKDESESFINSKFSFEEPKKSPPESIHNSEKCIVSKGRNSEMQETQKNMFGTFETFNPEDKEEIVVKSQNEDGISRYPSEK